MFSNCTAFGLKITPGNHSLLIILSMYRKQVKNILPYLNAGDSVLLSTCVHVSEFQRFIDLFKYPASLPLVSVTIVSSTSLIFSFLGLISSLLFALGLIYTFWLFWTYNTDCWFHIFSCLKLSFTDINLIQDSSRKVMPICFFCVCFQSLNCFCDFTLDVYIIYILIEWWCIFRELCSCLSVSCFAELTCIA